MPTSWRLGPLCDGVVRTKRQMRAAAAKQFFRLPMVRLPFLILTIFNFSANGFSGGLCTDIVPTELASEEREAGEGDVSPGGSDFPWAAITAPQLALLVAICLLTLFCTAFMVNYSKIKICKKQPI